MQTEATGEPATAEAVVRVAGHRALDFVNTEVWEDGPTDRLGTEADVWAWAQACEISVEPCGTGVSLARVRALRADFRALFPEFTCNGNRAVLFRDHDTPPEGQIALLIRSALTYHQKR